MNNGVTVMPAWKTISSPEEWSEHFALMTSSGEAHNKGWFVFGEKEPPCYPCLVRTVVMPARYVGGMAIYHHFVSVADARELVDAAAAVEDA